MNALAIIIPFYKIEFFEETLKSIARQTDKRFSLYVGNDKSPEDPLPLIQKYFPAGDYKYYNYDDNVGGRNLVLQWERLLENVTEEWFQILGDDDMISENFVEEFYRDLPEIKGKKINIIKYSQVFIDKDSQQLLEFTDYHNKIISTAEFFRYKFILKHNSSLSEHIYRHQSFKQRPFKKYPLAWHSDDMSVIEHSLNGIYFINTAQVYVRVSPISISGNPDNSEHKNLGSYLFFGDILQNHLLQINVEDRPFFIKKYLDLCWATRKMPQINIFTAYYLANKPIKVVFAIFTLWKLRRNCKTKIFN